MHNENVLKCITVIAGADLTTKQYHFAKINSSGKMVSTVLNDASVGVIQDKPNTDEAGVLAISGVSRVRAGGAITAGADVQSNASGRAITLGAGVKIGVALESATADGEYISVLIKN